MSYPLRLAAKLSGNTRAQLNGLRTKGIVVPEIRPYRPPLYSFRDLVALRSIAFLRGKTSAQKITRALSQLDVMDLTNHPSEYVLGTDGDSIYLEREGQALDLVRKPGRPTIFTFDQVTAEFKDFRDQTVAPFRRPSQFVEVNPARMGGWPTVLGTRISYDTIANLVDDVTVTADEVPHYYPSVEPAAVRDVLRFDRAVRDVA